MAYSKKLFLLHIALGCGSANSAGLCTIWFSLWSSGWRSSPDAGHAVLLAQGGSKSTQPSHTVALSFCSDVANTMFLHIPVAKACHLAKPRVNGWVSRIKERKEQIMWACNYIVYTVSIRIVVNSHWTCWHSTTLL